jgi:hypothetical protein
MCDRTSRIGTPDQVIGTFDQGRHPASAPAPNQRRNRREAKTGSAIKKCERTIIPFRTRTGEKSA